MDKRAEYLQIPSKQFPRFFGMNPKLARKHRKSVGYLFKDFLTGSVRLGQFFSELHPEVYLIPSDVFGEVIDEYGDGIGFERLRFPFSSYDFYVEEEKQGALGNVLSLAVFARLGQIPQLCYLVSPRQTIGKPARTWYLAPLFSHTRQQHSFFSGILAEILLAQNGFNAEESAPIVLAVALHDIATPAGGDSIVRIDRSKLHEENNFIWQLRRDDTLSQLEKRFNFDANAAARWIRGENLPGKLIDIVDKLSYVALDCYQVGINHRGMIRKFCQRYPLVMDVWQDIRINRDKQLIYFTNSERLFRFLLLRAYEHSEFLLNPYSRSMDFYLTKMTKVLYDEGLVSREDLLFWDNTWLEKKLEQRFPKTFKVIICPDELKWKKFTTEAEQLAFAKSIGTQLDHLDDVKGFDPCLDWLVETFGGIKPLCQVISPSKRKKLETIAESTKGHYVYYQPDKGKE